MIRRNPIHARPSFNFFFSIMPFFILQLHWNKAENPAFLAEHQAPVVQTLDNAIHRINHYPADKYYRNQLRYPLDRDLSGG